MKKIRKASFGFTLVEVMVALAIVAVCLMAGLKAMGALTDNTVHMEQNFLGNLCVQNAVNNLILGGTLPDEGESTNTCQVANQTLDVVMSVSKTPNEATRIIFARAMKNGFPIVSVITVATST